MVAGKSSKARGGVDAPAGQHLTSGPGQSEDPANPVTQRAPPRRSGRSLAASAAATPGQVTPAAGSNAASNQAQSQAKPAARRGKGPGRQHSHSATPGPSSVAAKSADKGGAAGKRGIAAAAAKEGSKVPGSGPPRKKSRLSAKAEDDVTATAVNRDGGPGSSSRGKRSLQAKGSVTFKDLSEEEGTGKSDTELESSSDEEGSSDESESGEEVADQTVYEPPPEAAVPPETSVEAPGGPCVTIPTRTVGELLAAWNVMRAFSWQLRLSPFSFADFCAAMASPLPTTLMDEVHLCVLRALAVDETPAEREEHALDLALLDAMTWPCFAWEWLRLTEDPLSRHEWAHRASRDHAAEPGGMKAAAAGAARGAQTSPRVACAPLPDMAAMDTELAAASAAHSTADRGRAAAAGHLPTSTPTLFATASSKDQLKGYFTARPQPRPGQQDYYGLPLGAKAAILSRLCDHLLDCPTIRAEIDRREREGQWVAGQGGQGGAFPILTPDQRKKAEKKAQTDANADCCVLCGAGGSLICCDGCPAAYHMRCLGLNAKSLGEGDWLCPECAVGGRGEAAGLRIPAGARGKHRQAYFALHGILVRCGVPTVKSRGKHAEELEESVPMALFQGEAASAELAEHAQRVRSADELPHPSSFEALKGSLPEATTEGPSGPEGYVNKYKNGWAAATNHLRTTVEELKRAKGKKGTYIPTGTSGLLPVPELPAPLTLSKFQWVQLQGKGSRAAIRCGKCHTCLNPSLRKGCLNPVVRPDEEGGADTSKLSFLVAWARKVERDFWQLLEGPWAEGGGRGMAHKNAWLASVRSATTVEQLAKAVVALEAALRPVALAPGWRAGESAGAGARTPAASQAVSRAVSVADLASGAGGQDACGPAAAGDAPSTTKDQPQDAQQLLRPQAGRAADPYDLKSDTAVLRGMWEIDRRSHAAQVAGVNRLPRALLRKAARQSGWQPIPGIKYRRFKWTLASPRLAWVAAIEAASTAAQLAVCLRQLDAVLQWDSVNRPKADAETPFYQATLLSKRPASGEDAPPGSFEYLLQMQPPPTPDPVQQQAGTGLAGQQRLGLMPSQQAQQQQQQLNAQRAMAGQLAMQAIATATLLPVPLVMPLLPLPPPLQHGQQAGRLGSLAGPLGFVQQHTPRVPGGLSPSPGLAGSGMLPLPHGLAGTGGSLGGAPAQLLRGTLSTKGSALLPRPPAAAGAARAPQTAGRSQVRLRDVLQQARAASQEPPQLQGQTHQPQQQQQHEGEKMRDRRNSQRQAAGSHSGGEEPAPMALDENAVQQQPEVQQQQEDEEEQQQTEQGGQQGAPEVGPTTSRPRTAAAAAPPPGAAHGDVAVQHAGAAAAASEEDLDAELYDSDDVDQNEAQQRGPASTIDKDNAAGAPVASQGATTPAAAPAAAATTSGGTSRPAWPESRLTGRARSSTAAAASSAPTPPLLLLTAAAGSELASLGGVDQEGEPSGQQLGRRGGKVRRCGVCKSCLNPTAKQACLQLRAEREAQQAQQTEESAARLKEELRKLEDPAHLARLITAAAFRAALADVGAEELKSPDAPAAMAAKLRARLSSMSGPLGSTSKGLSPAVKKEQGEDGNKSQGMGRAPSSSRLSALPAGRAAAGDLMPKPEHEPTVLLPGAAALPLKVALASNQPAWVHERYLPLWLIKSYEEKVRREEANAAAKEATAAARNQQLTSKGDMESARSAARAAAAAAADACAVCGALHGESEDLDALWISCDHCERWFHGGCVGIVQADVDAIGDGQPWACPGCWDTLRRRERASRRQQAKHAEQGAAAAAVGPAASQQPSEGQGPDGVEGGGARRGRPPKPFWQKADYQRKEQQALERIRRQHHREAVAAGLEPPSEPGDADAVGLGGRKRRRGEAEQPGGERQGEQIQPASDKEAREAGKSEEAGGEDEEEEEPVYCPLCKLPDYGRDLVECDSCQQWYHPECAGVTLEEVEAVPRWACAGCQGKRMRAPSQAAILAAIEAAREREEAADAAEAAGTGDERDGSGSEQGPWGSAARPRKRLSGTAAAAAAAAAGREGGRGARGGGARGDAGAAAEAPPWVATALQVLAKVMELPSAADFLRPVPRSVEGYRTVIKRPMDLGTVRQKLQQGKYATPRDMLADTRLIWDNCRAFNEDGSEIVAAADEAQAALEAAWAALGLPRDPLEARPARRPQGLPSTAQGEPGVEDWIQRQRAARRQEAQQAASAAREAAALSKPPRTARRSAAGRELLASLRAASPGKEAGGRQETAQSAGGAGNMVTVAGVAAPTAAVSDGNAGAAGHPSATEGAPPVGSQRLRRKQLAAHSASPRKDASEAAREAQRLRQAQPPQQAHQQQHRPEGSRSRGRQLPLPDWPSHAAKVLKAVMRLRDAESFLLPVPGNYPGYHKVVKHPMDLGTVSKKLQQGKYQDPAHLKDDVELVWSNCRLFNDESAPVLAACAVVEAAFRKHWKSSSIFQAAATTSADGVAAGVAAAAAIREGAGWRDPGEERVGAGAHPGGGVSGGSKSHKGPYDWKAAARAVLYRLQLQKSARWFMEPVRPEEAPDYEELVQQPMDFGTISQKLASDKYASPSELLTDVRLIWDNCHTYNGADSPVAQDSEAARAVFEASWAEKGLAQLAPLDVSVQLAALAAQLVPEERSGAWPVEKAARDAPGGGTGLAAAAAATAALQQSPRGTARTRRSLGGGLAAAGFNQQEEEQQQQQQAKFGFGAGSQTHGLAGAAAPSEPAGARDGSGGRLRTSSRGATAAPRAAAPAPAAPPEWLAKAQQAIKRVLRLPEAQVFAQPVSREVAPDYHKVVKRPMDLGTILRGIAAGHYASPEAAAADAQLIWDNCRAYNEPGDAVWHMGEVAEATFHQQWAAAGLPTEASNPTGEQQQQLLLERDPAGGGSSSRRRSSRG